VAVGKLAAAITLAGRIRRTQPRGGRINEYQQSA
jgi:hypothetical protein